MEGSLLFQRQVISIFSRIDFTKSHLLFAKEALLRRKNSAFDRRRPNADRPSIPTPGPPNSSPLFGVEVKVAFRNAGKVNAFIRREAPPSAEYPVVFTVLGAMDQDCINDFVGPIAQRQRKRPDGGCSGLTIDRACATKDDEYASSERAQIEACKHEAKQRWDEYRCIVAQVVAFRHMDPAFRRLGLISIAGRLFGFNRSSLRSKGSCRALSAWPVQG